jgi:hypothetical protein
VEPVRVFASFDLDHDVDLSDRLVAESDGRRIFSVSDRSESGPVDGGWTARARGRIAAADEVIVLCGEHTDQSAGVCAELRIAQEERKPYLFVWGRRERMCKKPRGARPGDAMYSWTSAILEEQIASLVRAKPEPGRRRS